MLNWASTALGKLSRTIRTKLAKAIVPYRDPKQPLQAVVRDYQLRSESTMVRDAYAMSKKYLEVDEVVESIAKGDQTQDEIVRYVTSVAKYHRFFDDHVFLEPHTRLLRGLNELLESTMSDLEDPIDDQEFYNQFKKLADKYAERVADWFYLNQEDTPEQTVQKSILEPAWYARSSSDSMYVNIPTDRQPEIDHSNALQRLAILLIDERVPDSAIITVLTPILATAGFYWLGIPDFPFSLNVLPYHYILAERDAIWNQHMEKKHEDPEDYVEPSEANDAPILAAQDEESNDLDEYHIDAEAANATTKPSKCKDPLDEKPKRRRKGKKDQQQQQQQSSDKVNSSSGGPPPPPPPPPPPTIPHDVSYIPNQQMSLKVKDLTAWLKANLPLPDEKDHLKRFGANTYDPIPVRKIDLLSTDTRIFQGPSVLSQMYMVTYTRTSIKPIFNPVN